MFFQICDSKLDNFPVNYQHNNLFVNLDHGWNKAYDSHNNTLFYKGYLDKGNLEHFILDIAQQEEPYLTGNFCLIKCFDQGVSIKTDRYRNFPIYYDDKSLTNLHCVGSLIYTDSFVMIQDNLKKIESKFELIKRKELKNITFDDCIEKVDLILQNKFKTFFQSNSLPLQVFLSGGVDTTTLYSYVLKLNIPHILVDNFHTDFDYFFLKNHHYLSNHWGYRQLHYWLKPCILMSGTLGDEFTARSPSTANMLLRYYDTSIDELLDNKKDSMMYFYFLKYTNFLKSQKHLEYQTLGDVVSECSNIIVNDYQHWHLGNTITYTPYRDIEIFETIASLNKEDLVEQIFNGIVQKELIKRNAPHLLKTLSTSKNTHNHMENLTNIFSLKT